MSEPIRILVRLAGAILFFGSIAGILTVLALGPDEIGRQMGKSCRHSQHGPSQHCTWQEALSILKALPIVCLVGGVLLVTMTRGTMGRSATPAPSSPARRRLNAIGGAAMVVVILLNFPVAYGYAATYKVVTLTNTTKEILREAPAPPAAPTPLPN